MCVALWLVSLVRAPSPLVEPPRDPAPSLVRQRLEQMLDNGTCWNDGGSHPFPQHAFYVTPGSRLRYGPSAPALAIVFGVDGVRYSGDEPPGTVYAFCR